MDTGFAPKALKVSMKMGDPTTRLFKPVQILWFANGPFRIGQFPETIFSPSQTENSLFLNDLKNLFPRFSGFHCIEVLVIREKEGKEKRFSSFTVGDQLIVEPTAKSATPCRRMRNSFVCIPAKSCPAK